MRVAEGRVERSRVVDGGRYPAKVTALGLVDVMLFEGGVLPARRGTPQL